MRREGKPEVGGKGGTEGFATASSRHIVGGPPHAASYAVGRHPRFPAPPLQAINMANPTPAQKSTKEETFRALCSDFTLDERVFDHFMKSLIGDLEDFRFFFVEEKDIAPGVASVAIYDENIHIQEARLRRAWHTVRHPSSFWSPHTPVPV